MECHVAGDLRSGGLTELSGGLCTSRTSSRTESDCVDPRGGQTDGKLRPLRPLGRPSRLLLHSALAVHEWGDAAVGPAWSMELGCGGANGFMEALTLRQTSHLRKPNLANCSGLGSAALCIPGNSGVEPDLASAMLATSSRDPDITDWRRVFGWVGVCIQSI